MDAVDIPNAASGPTATLQLVGHPLRWRLLGELARSDRTVQELVRLTGEPQNLVSYHLGKLRDARLVVAQRSVADRRDTYYAIDLARIAAQLAAAARALHPGLPEAGARGAVAPSAVAAPARAAAALAPPATGAATVGPPTARVLFLCTGNSARSQIAEALLRVRSGGTVEAVSAGSHPKPLHPHAIRVMREDFGIDIANQVPKSMAQFAGQPFDPVISLCDRVREACPELLGQPATVHWSTPNPATGDTADASSYPLFRAVAAALDVRIGFLLATLADRPRTEPRSHAP